MLIMMTTDGYQALVYLLLLHCGFVAVQSQTPTVITQPGALTTSSGNVVEGSVIQVYCTVESNNDISFTWTLNGMALLNDPPHIRIRTNTDGTDTTSVLTVDNFRDTDNGVYQCTATDTKSMAAGNGTAITLTAVDSTPDGTLMIVSGPSDNEPVDVAAILNDNRTGIALGGTVDGSLLTCIAGHQGDGVMNYSPPSVVWVRNGQPVDDTDSRITITPTTMANGQLSSSLTITNFALSDAGVYQCVFTDSDGGTELITTVPYRLDTGDTVTIERVSPEVIILRPPEKLVIEVRTTGEYQVHFWFKNENLFGTTGNFQVMFPDELPNFAEIFVRDNTTNDDLGIYRVRPTLTNANAQTHTIIPSSDGVDFAVIAPEDANTIAVTSIPVVILEGGSTNISCRSVGAPAPSITWELDNQIVSFEQTDTVTQFEATLTGTVKGQRGTDVTLGNIISELHIVSASYPDHDGVYTCIGTNSDDLSVASSSATVTVQVQVIPEVEITATFTRVNLGENLTLTCSVIRGNPTNYIYSIVHINTTTTTSEPTRMLTGIQESDLGTYRCDVTNDAGTGSANITIELGEPQCPVGSYEEDLSTGERVCVPCPANSFSTMKGSRECTCFEDYFRTALEEPNYPCTSPPSACRQLQIVSGRTKATTITVRWDRPEITGREDFYYNIFYSEDNQTFIQHNPRPYIKQDAVVDYTLSGLKALTMYTVRVSVENGVSDQDERRDQNTRSCEIIGSTGDTRANAPSLVLGLCTNVVWTAPTRTYGRIIGYDMNFVLPGSDEDVIISKERRELFHVIGDEIAPSNEMSMLVQVRAKTSSANGRWSELVPLGCAERPTCPP